MTITSETKRSLYRDMLRSRKVELKIESLYLDDDMKTPIHLYIGQEAIAAGVCANLRTEDPIFTTYRSHGQYLSKGGDLNRMIAELHCKETGCSRGRGGSMHLIDLSAGHYGSSAIVGGGIPIAAGMALAKKMRGEDHVTAVFFGDGAADQGVFYESVNFAMLKQLPVLFILENNQWAVCSSTAKRKPGENIFHSADPELLFSAKIDGNDVLAVHDAAQQAVDRARAGKGPSFIECMTYRVRGHGGVGSDAHLGHRTEEEIAEWEGRCPLETFKDALQSEGLLADEDLSEMERTMDEEIEAAFEFARSSPLPRGEDVAMHLYRE